LRRNNWVCLATDPVCEGRIEPALSGRHLDLLGVFDAPVLAIGCDHDVEFVVEGVDALVVDPERVLEVDVPPGQRSVLLAQTPDRVSLAGTLQLETAWALPVRTSTIPRMSSAVRGPVAGRKGERSTRRYVEG